MKLLTRCFPAGPLPYESFEAVTRMVAKLFEKNPYLPILPKLEPQNTLISRTLGHIPGINIDENGSLFINVSTNAVKTGLKNLDKAFNRPDSKTIEPYEIDSIFLEKYLQIIKKFKSPHAYLTLLGPFTISQILMKIAKEQMISDKSFRKLFIQSVSVKALWMINKIKEYCPDTVPIIILDESYLGQLGTLKRENEEVTTELVTTMLSRVVETIKSVGAICAVQCMEKCDWQVAINAGADIISFDAYNNPNNLNIIPDQVTKFLKNGGHINWGIVPVATESLVKGLNISYVTKRLKATHEGLILAGVPADLVTSTALVSVVGDVSKLPLIFAEKAIMLSTQLAKKLIVKH